MLADIEESIITAVKAPFEAAYPLVGICWPNGPFDWNNPPERHVVFEVENYGGDQIGIAGDPKTRVRGYVYVEVRVRDGMGSRPAISLLDWFMEQLEYKYLNTTVRITLQNAEPDSPSSFKGWYARSIKIPFHADPA